MTQDAGAAIEPFVVADTRNGPVLVDAGAVVHSFSRLEGPCYVGPESWVLGAKLRGGTVGPRCRVGGEFEASILHANSNKYHDGFLGHSYVGEWVNLGAGTQISDLRKRAICNYYRILKRPIPLHLRLFYTNRVLYNRGVFRSFARGIDSAMPSFVRPRSRTKLVPLLRRSSTRVMRARSPSSPPPRLCLVSGTRVTRRQSCRVSFIR